MHGGANGALSGEQRLKGLTFAVVNAGIAFANLLLRYHFQKHKLDPRIQDSIFSASLVPVFLAAATATAAISTRTGTDETIIFRDALPPPSRSGTRGLVTLRPHNIFLIVVYYRGLASTLHNSAGLKASVA